MDKRITWHDGIRVLFGIYSALMLWLLFDRSGAISGVPYWQQVEANLNLTPLHTIGNYWHILANRAYYLQKWEFAGIYEYHARHAFVNLGGNVVMFVPLGIFLPEIFVKLRAFRKLFLCAAGIILAVELLQLFTLLGSCDIDDLILNLVGASFGYGIWKIFQKHSIK